MTTEEAINELRDASDSEVRYGDTEHHYNEVMKRIEAFDMAIKALEQEPCEDCTVIKKLSKKYYIEDAYGYTDENIVSKLNEIIDVVNKLSSVTSTRPTGKWILKRTFPTKMYDEYLNEYECSECHRGIRCTDAQLVNYPYCHCGARMTESEDKE